MLDESRKSILKPRNPRSGLSVRNPQHRPYNKLEMNKEKMATDSQTSADTSPHRNSNVRLCRKLQNNQMKVKLLDVAPKEPAKETSKGVQEFIRNVSDFIEKKTPFKESAIYPSTVPTNKTNTASISSIQFNGVMKKSQERKVETFKLESSYVANEDNKDLMVKSKPRHMSNLNFLSCDSESTKKKISQPNRSSKKRKECEKSERRRQIEQSPVLEKCMAALAKTSTSNPQWIQPKHETDAASRGLEKASTYRARSQDRAKPRRPSEIPLRKNRGDFAKKPATVLPLLQDKMKNPADFFHEDKLFKAIGELSFCPALTVGCSFENGSTEENSTDLEPLKEISVEEVSKKNIMTKHSKNSLSLDIPKNSLSKIDSSSGRKSSAGNSDKVKTSSFTLIRTNSDVLTRLESLHKKNVSKEKFLSKKSTPKKKVLVSKTSFSSLKRKASKKGLFARSSSKGNKPGLRRKSKQDGSGEKGNPQQSKAKIESNTVAPEIVVCKEFVENKKVERIKPDSPAKKTLKTSASKSKKETNLIGTKTVSSRGKSSKKAQVQKASEEIPLPPTTHSSHSKSESDSHKLEKPKSAKTGSVGSKHILKYSESEENLRKILQTKKIMPVTPPPTPEIAQATVISGIHCESSEDCGWSANLVFENHFNSENFPWPEIDSREKKELPETEANTQKPSSEDHSEGTAAAASPPVTVRGTHLNFGQEKPNELNQPTAKKHLKIDLRTHEKSNEFGIVECKSSPDLTSPNDENQEGVPRSTEKAQDDVQELEKRKSETNSPTDSFPEDLSECLKSPSFLQKSRKSYLPLKRKPQFKLGESLKGKKNKIRSDAGDRPCSIASDLWTTNVSRQVKPDTKLRSGLTKSSNREEMRDVFESAGAVKLKRRNSEPNSFRGYVLKSTDGVAPRGQKPSVSSMTSSLRHLNTDEIDDFVLWEVIPQRMTSCWEMSLYHFRRPWSVLSCSVFKDNRMSSTPGLILENLRNGGTLSSRRLLQTDRATCRKENPFDVEPSIAQKNIDIRNWLAALNFPTPASTSSDGLTEDSFSAPLRKNISDLNKVQGSSKRKKLPNLKVSDETPKKTVEEDVCRKMGKSFKWGLSECDGLTDLIRRKSGGFTTKEQYLNSEHPTYRHNIGVNYCVYSKSAEDSVLISTGDWNKNCDLRKFKSMEKTTLPQISISPSPMSPVISEGGQLLEKVQIESGLNNVEKFREENTLKTFFEKEFQRFFSVVNVWKYLFILTVFVIFIHYYSTNYGFHNN